MEALFPYSPILMSPLRSLIHIKETCVQDTPGEQEGLDKAHLWNSTSSPAGRDSGAATFQFPFQRSFLIQKKQRLYKRKRNVVSIKTCL